MNTLDLFESLADSNMFDSDILKGISVELKKAIVSRNSTNIKSSIAGNYHWSDNEM